MRLRDWINWAVFWAALSAAAVMFLLMTAAFAAWGCRYWQAF
jgi:hypothetical protein